MTDYIDEAPIDRQEILDQFIPLAEWIINQPILRLDQRTVSPEEIERARLKYWREIQPRIVWHKRLKNFFISSVS